MSDSITLTRPDDWHLHVRDGAMLASVVPDTARQFARAIIMPNLKPPVTTVEQAVAYRDRIVAVLDEETDFEPLMTLYLTESTTPEEIHRAAEHPFVHAVKYYPAGATTNADSGVTDLKKVDHVLAAMEEVGLPLLMHGEVTDHEIDIFDREAEFIDRELERLVDRFPKLPMVLEHITTEAAADFVRSGPDNLAATITVHHLLLNRNAIFEGGLRPHHYCLPVLKREQNRQALVAAATSGSPKFFLGTDSAPHPKAAKESDCGCAGIYTALHAMPLYAEAFEDAGALGKLEGFASHFGADFYRLPRNGDTITLERADEAIPDEVDFGGQPGVPLRAGGRTRWRVK
ncbi:dihydroorotase [Wenzhouxiangella marina]|uniref:Dihydroorotase n=1 Tax=Wenzhouxiangella marina TaxID=1579979 RepID=A0A0K0XZY8_9GAMM|nr:dihydroorotase [Wenzhouxiangella marina]AKS43249.1 dihydroorotase [Wenzhouxiangella marina]MBB6087064.1 dihydroorotase [Wenzhouxiangella marina]